MLTSGAVQLLLDSLAVLIYGTLMMVNHVKLSLAGHLEADSSKHRAGSDRVDRRQKRAGKSTHANLLIKLFTPSSGTIRIDGHAIRHIHTASLRRKIGIVQQENRVVRATIQDNIAIRFPSATLEEVEAAAKLAGSHAELIEAKGLYPYLVSQQLN